MSRFTEDFAAEAEGDLLHEHGEEITRYPGGVVGDAVATVGIFQEAQPERVTSDGITIVRRATLRLASTDTVSTEDTYLIFEEIWQVMTVRRNGAGMKVAQLERQDEEATTRNDEGRVI